MQTPNNEAGKLTEEIMRAFSLHSKEGILALDTALYNKVYSHVYKTLAASARLR